MPEVSRFYGIIIRFYYRDHPPTHFHAVYGEHQALVETWRTLHLQELRENWNRSRQQQPLMPIAGLD